jgi:RNA polymerase sigma-70 factor (ECF subfamily)
MDTLPIKLRMTDLILSARQGNLEAYNHLVMKHQESVYNLVYQVLGDEKLATETTQATFLHAFNNLHGYHSASSAGFRIWLLQQAVRACVRSSQQRPRQSLRSLDQSGGLVPGLQALTADLRLVVALVDLEGLTYQEAAAALETSVSQVCQRLARARQQLACWLQIRSPDVI